MNKLFIRLTILFFMLFNAFAFPFDHDDIDEKNHHEIEDEFDYHDDDFDYDIEELEDDHEHYNEKDDESKDYQLFEDDEEHDEDHDDEHDDEYDDEYDDIEDDEHNDNHNHHHNNHHNKHHNNHHDHHNKHNNTVQESEQNIINNLEVKNDNMNLEESIEYMNHIDAHAEFLVDKFEEWIEKFDIEFYNVSHLHHLFHNWVDNDIYINEMNLKNLTYKLEHNIYSGYNSSEFSKLMGYRKINFFHKEIPTEIIYNTSNIPSSFDWRDKHVVNEIKNQGECGSCWAFSGVSTIESAVAIKTGKLYNLSVQEVISCSDNDYDLLFNNQGCNGGMYDVLWKFVSFNGGLCSEESYPYTSGKGISSECKINCTIIRESKVIDHVIVKPNSDSDMIYALNVNPISIAINANSRSFQFYKSGIYSDYEGCGGNEPKLDHAVVLVGYTPDYYIMRNSWGTSWGNYGYMYMARGDKYGNSGMCGLLSIPMYPIV